MARESTIRLRLKVPAGWPIVARSFAALALLSFTANTQQIPLRHYDDSSGLPNNNVSCIHQDRKGYLWIGTGDGLSRFDGYSFVSYSEREGLGHRVVNTIAEDRDGNLWIGTNGAGIARFIDDPPELFSTRLERRKEHGQQQRSKFVHYTVGDSSIRGVHSGTVNVNVILFDEQDTLWCNTDGGIFRAIRKPAGDRDFEPVIATVESTPSGAGLVDSKKRLWFILRGQLVLIDHDQIRKYDSPAGFGRERFTDIVEDRHGRLLVTTATMLFEFAPDDHIERPVWRRLPLTLMPGQRVITTSIDSKGTTWIGTTRGLIKYFEGRQTVYTGANGLSEESIGYLREDREGDLWIATSAGLSRFSSEAIVSFTKKEGPADKKPLTLIEDRSGRIYASTRDAGILEIIGAKAVPVAGSQSGVFKNTQSRILQDSRGDWWIGTDVGLFCFHGPTLQFKRGKKFRGLDGISEERVSNGPGIYEDPAARMWVGSHDGYLYKLEQPGGLFERIPYGSSGLTDIRRMVSDRSGGLWVAGFYGIGRLKNGAFVKVGPAPGLPDPEARALFVDSRGWLWIGLRHRGVSMTTDPVADNPQFVNFSTETGLVSDIVWSIAEDDAGRMYLGTERGIDQLDPLTGKIRHITSEDGLASNQIASLIKDHQGEIWVGTPTGISKISPRVEQSLSGPPPIFFSRIQVAGEDIPLPETGAFEVPELTLSPSQNNLLVAYTGISLRGEKALQYQYKLEGVSGDWSEPSDRRSLDFARVSPGLYRLMVRAINQNGIASASPATLQFRILPPIWQRWWFMMLAGIAIGTAVYVMYHYRVSRLVEIERVRTRIAADLHDDLGSSLTQIAMLSEVVRHNPRRDDTQVDERLSLIANISRESVQSMSDIVWAVNPQKDKLSHVTQRMRRLASDILVARNIAFDFRAPASSYDITLGANARREVFLIFKEAVNNLVRHSCCKTAAIDLRVERGWLILTISDDGGGFDATRAAEGNGIQSMRTRAKKLGGDLDIVTQSGSGTVLTLNVPVGYRGRARFRRNGRNAAQAEASLSKDGAGVDQ